MKIQNSVAFVTGANRGLGLAYAQALLAAGARKVYAGARDPSTVPSLDGLVPVRLDVNNAADIAAAAAQCGDVDLVINNAGVIGGDSLLGDNGVDALRAVMETNLYGVFAVSRAFAPVLGRNGGGALVNMLSALSWASLPGTGDYSVSKAAAWALTNGLRNELRGQGTQVVAVHAGYIDTDMVKTVEAPKSKPADVAQAVLAGVEAGASEVLADDTARYVKAGFGATPSLYLGSAG
ncbi:short-chain dehydrogenase [Rhodanobacter sp. Root561]|jgi:NAD(P)-dependent dehydrogenase (short-subunit alcohol dehydrogenase family)|uniref:SDR family oxidoreductase n=1 Tax=Rhodanobacter sp. Root561 TaxID=1736560 RepID=UPI000700AF18|nr:SDR family oxidoreductase [Rhodanobacter sp. Root561]KQZ69228.1 short-chain dehydrogenase [Rhodanobacter sp. Root561]